MILFLFGFNVNVSTVMQSKEAGSALLIKSLRCNFIHYLSSKKQKDIKISHDELIENIVEESDEEPTFVNRNEESKKKTNQINSTIVGTQILNILIPHKKDSFEAKLQGEEIEFMQKIKEIRSCFFKNEFNDIANKIKSTVTITDNKFNFIFERYKYGDNLIEYMIRCIDKKNDIEGSEKSEASSMNKNNIQKITTIMQNEFTHLLRKSRNESLSRLHEILNEEKKQLIDL